MPVAGKIKDSVSCPALHDHVAFIQLLLSLKDSGDLAHLKVIKLLTKLAIVRDKITKPYFVLNSSSNSSSDDD